MPGAGAVHPIKTIPRGETTETAEAFIQRGEVEKFKRKVGEVALHHPYEDEEDFRSKLRDALKRWGEERKRSREIKLEAGLYLIGQSPDYRKTTGDLYLVGDSTSRIWPKIDAEQSSPECIYIPVDAADAPLHKEEALDSSDLFYILVARAADPKTTGPDIRVHPGSYGGLTKLSHHQPDRRPA